MVIIWYLTITNSGPSPNCLRKLPALLHEENSIIYGASKTYQPKIKTVYHRRLGGRTLLIQSQTIDREIRPSKRHLSIAETKLPLATKLRQGNIFTGVCQSFCSRGGLCSGGVSVRGGLCLGGSLLGRTPPYSNERAVRILLECILVTKSASGTWTFI